MKTTYKYKAKAVVFFLLLSAIIHANNTDVGKHKKTKTLTKEYLVSADNTVNISNKYGDISITSWNQNKVSIEVIITVKSSSENAAKQRFNDINISFNQEANQVTAKTTINKKRFNWNFFEKNNSIDTQIDYIIKMPISNHVDLKNDYGSIFIDKLDGECKINCDYGALRIGELNNEHNRIYMDYGSSSSIEFINKGKINTDYSNLSIDKANKLKINADYSNIEIDQIHKLVYNNDYGSLKLKHADSVKGDGDYLSLKVNYLHQDFLVSCDYGSIKIYKVLKGFDNLTIDSDYTGINIGFEDQMNFNFDLSTSYADIYFKSLDVNYNYKENKMFSKHYKGFVNTKNTKSNIRITSSYANIKLHKASE